MTDADFALFSILNIGQLASWTICPAHNLVLITIPDSIQHLCMTYLYVTYLLDIFCSLALGLNQTRLVIWPLALGIYVVMSTCPSREKTPLLLFRSATADSPNRGFVCLMYSPAAYFTSRKVWIEN